MQEEVGRPVRGDGYGNCHADWTSEFGRLNQVWHLWRCDSLDDRARQRQRPAPNRRWTSEYVPNVQPLLSRHQVRVLNLVKDLNPPKRPGGMYELRIHRMHPGRTAGRTEAFRDIMPVGEKYSPNGGIRTGGAPPPNEAVRMSNHLRPQCAHAHAGRRLQGSRPAGVRRRRRRLDRRDACDPAAAEVVLADEAGAP